jgi:hypothetical protein
MRPNQPVPWVKLMSTTTYQYDRLYHHLVTGRTMSGIIHFVNLAPLIFFCKKQQTLETAPNQYEFMFLCQAAKQFINHIYTLCMMGIPLCGPS